MSDLKLKRIVMEVFGGCNYTCQMCPQTDPGRGKHFTRKMPLKNFEKILDDIVPKYGTRTAPPHPDDVDLPLFIEVDRVKKDD